MKFKIVVDSKKGRIEIPLDKSEIRALGDLAFWFDDSDWKNFKLNKMEKSISSLIKKWIYLNYDILDDGRSYRIEKTKKGRMKYIFAGHHYMIKKPKWKK